MHAAELAMLTRQWVQVEFVFRKGKFMYHFSNGNRI